MNGKQKPADEVIGQAVERISTSLSILTTVQLAKEFYTESERSALLNDYRKLSDAHDATYEALFAVINESGTRSHGEIAAAAGVAAADEHFKPRMDAIARREETGNAISEFRSQHPLIAAIWDAREKISKTL